MKVIFSSIFLVLVSCFSTTNQLGKAYLKDFSYSRSIEINSASHFFNDTSLHIISVSDDKMEVSILQHIMVFGSENFTIEPSLIESNDTIYLKHQIVKTHDEAKQGEKVRVDDGIRYYDAIFHLSLPKPIDSLHFDYTPKY